MSLDLEGLMTVALQPQTAASRGASLASPFHELRRARQVQGRLLATRSATCGGLECGGCSRPARGLGGDLFDFVPFAAGRFALAVGDASGKGIAAALIATVLQAGLRSQYDGPTAELAARVRGLNRLLYCSGRSEDDSFTDP